MGVLGSPGGGMKRTKSRESASAEASEAVSTTSQGVQILPHGVLSSIAQHASAQPHHVGIHWGSRNALINRVGLVGKSWSKLVFCSRSRRSLPALLQRRVTLLKSISSWRPWWGAIRGCYPRIQPTAGITDKATKCRESNALAINSLIELGAQRISSLDLSNCEALEAKTMNALINCCSNLTAVRLSRLAAFSVLELAVRVPALTALEFDQCKLTDLQTSALIEQLTANCRSLQKLSVMKLQPFSDVQINLLADRCPNLQSLCVAGCVLVTDASITRLVQSCRLRELDLAGCSLLTDEVLMQITERCSAMTSLDVSCLPSVTANSLLTLTRCTGLVKLHMNRLHGAVTDSVLSEIVNSCRSLRSLEVTLCNKLSDKSIIKLAQCCPALDTLNVKLCKKLTDKAITTVATLCPELTTLIIAGCVKLTNAAVNKLVDCCDQLSTLDAEGCRLLDVDAIAHLTSV